MSDREARLEAELAEARRRLVQSDSEWKASISGTMKAVMTQLGEVSTSLAGVKEAVHQVNKHEKLLTGGSDPENGLVMKVDRLSQSHKNSVWVLRSCATAAIGSAVAAIWQLIHGGK